MLSQAQGKLEVIVGVEVEVEVRVKLLFLMVGRWVGVWVVVGR